MSDIDFHILIRKPKYPLIVISSTTLYPAFDIMELAQNCVKSTLSDGETFIKAIDSYGEEFWYTPEKYIIAPGFFCKKWTKKKIVELYNNSLNGNQKEYQYSTQSLSSKRLDKIVLDICKSLNKMQK